MPKTVTATEAKNRLGALLGYVVGEGDEVIVERQGRPSAVIMSFAAYEEVEALREQKRRTDALEQLRALRRQVRARNQDLSAEEAMALADRFVHEVIDEMAAEGKLTFERDRHRP